MEKEAIRILKNEKFWEGNARISKAFETAIAALEEIQPYRVLEQKLQSVYGEHEGLLEIVVNGLARYENAPNKAIRAVLLTDEDVDRWEAYKAIGTVRDFEVLKERIEPKKVLRLQDKYECPSCHKQLKYRELLCCGLCGQKLDWNE